MQRLEVVREHSEFLSHFSIPQANPAQPVRAGLLEEDELVRDELAHPREGSSSLLLLLLRDH